MDILAVITNSLEGDIGVWIGIATVVVGAICTLIKRIREAICEFIIAIKKALKGKK